MPSSRAGQRDLRLDFFRGLALFFIFIDHIPGNTFSYFTLNSFAFCDAAEVFIFISGYTAAMVYGRTMETMGPLFATAQVWRRVWQLYVAHVFLFMIFTAEVSWTVLRFNNPMYSEEMRVADFLAEPHVAIIKALLLQFQPTFLDILPLYIVLLLGFPVVLLLLRWRLWAPLVPALPLYAGVQLFGWTPGAYPNHAWFFNPLAWQLLFVIGAVLGYARACGKRVLPTARWPVMIVGTFALAATVIRLSWTIHGLYDPFPGLLLGAVLHMNKNNLAPLRLLDALALAWVTVHLVRPDARFLRTAAARYAVVCGQQSLQVFCLGILLSVLGHFIFSEYYAGAAVQISVNAGGIALMVGTALLLDWYKRLDRARQPKPEPLRPPAGASPGVAE